MLSQGRVYKQPETDPYVKVLAARSMSSTTWVPPLHMQWWRERTIDVIIKLVVAEHLVVHHHSGINPRLRQNQSKTLTYMIRLSLCLLKLSLIVGDPHSISETRKFDVQRCTLYSPSLSSGVRSVNLSICLVLGSIIVSCGHTAQYGTTANQWYTHHLFPLV